MAHEWRHLKMLKCTGRGHDPNGIASTKPGECVVLCPACPQPGKNMVPGWENDSPDCRLNLYYVFNWVLLISNGNLGIFTPCLFPLTQTSGWNGRMFQAIKRTLAWVRDGHISLRKPGTKHIFSNVWMRPNQYARTLNNVSLDTDLNFVEKHMLPS